MKNTLVVKIPFHFKGKLFEPSVQLDLDDWAKKGQCELSDLFSTVARENNIGEYSYELEVMEMSEILFEQPTGYAVDFYDSVQKVFDFEGFRNRWIANKSYAMLNPIAQTHMNQTLEMDSELHQALMAAFIAGKTAKD